MRKQGIAASPEAQGRLRMREKTKQHQLHSDMKAVMELPAGRRLMWHILDSVTSVFSGSFTGNSETFFREGRRDVGITLMKLSQAVDPDAYVLMLQEQLAHQREEQVHIQDAERVANKDDI